MEMEETHVIIFLLSDTFEDHGKYGLEWHGLCYNWYDCGLFFFTDMILTLNFTWKKINQF